jgi:hypothetical protein
MKNGIPMVVHYEYGKSIITDQKDLYVSRGLSMNPLCEGLPKASKEMNMNSELNKLIELGVITNLYRSPAMWEDEAYYDESDLELTESENGIEFLDHLYSMPFKSPAKDKVELVHLFLVKQIGIGYRSSMFQNGSHAPAIGIYNSITNELLAIGIGRKNRIFILSTDKSITDQNYSQFSDLDYLSVVRRIVEYLETAADYQLRVMEAIEEEDQESELAYSESLDEAIGNLVKAVPLLSNWMGDLSPGDF